MKQAYKIGFFAQKKEKLESGATQIVNTSIQILPEEFKTVKDAEAFIRGREEHFPKDNFERHFTVLKTLKSDAHE